MIATQRIGRHFLAAHGALMLCLGLAACILATLMANPAFARFGYMIAIVLTASCLVITGIYFGAIAYSERSRLPVTNYFAVGLLSIASWVIFWFIRSAPIDLRLLSLLAGMYGMFWGLWHVRLALHLRAFPAKATFLCILAAATSFLGIVLSTQSQPSQLSAVAVVAYYSMLIGIEILLATLYLYRECEALEGALSCDFLERGQVSIATDSRRSPIRGITTSQKWKKTHWGRLLTEALRRRGSFNTADRNDPQDA